MNIIRWFLGKAVLFFDSVFVPRSVQRTPEKQAKVDQDLKSLVVYQFEACPFCVKVRREMKRLNLKIELRDAKNPTIAAELVKGGGVLQVPCLRITDPDGSVRWMYESSDINSLLRSRFSVV